MWLVAMYVLTTLMAVYISFRGIKPLNIAKKYKIILYTIAILISYKFQLIHLIFGGRVFIPNVPSWVIFTSAWFFCCAAMFFILLFFRDIGVIAYNYYYLSFKKFSKAIFNAKILNLTTLYALILSMIFASIGLYFGMKKPEIKQQFIVFEDYPSNMSSLKIVIIADIHIDATKPVSSVQYIVDKANSLNPDLILLAGDILDDDLNLIKNTAEPLKDLKAKYGVYGVSGNHEQYIGYQESIKLLESLNIKMLENSSTTILDNKITIGGAVIFEQDNKQIEPNINKIFENSPKDNFRILLAHHPQIALSAKDENVDLQISGHTHGGIILGLNYLVKLLNCGFVSGLYNVDNMKLFVSNGTAIWNGFPIRFVVDSNIDYLILDNKTHLTK